MFPGEFFSIPRADDPFRLDSSTLFVLQLLFHLAVSADCEVKPMVLAYVLTQFSPVNFLSSFPDTD